MNAGPKQPPRIAVLVPTLNAGAHWSDWIKALQAQTLRPLRVLVQDSASQDATAQRASDAGFEVQPIARRDFSHGGTRQLGLQRVAGSVDFLVCLTQDAVLASPLALELLIAAFQDEAVGAAFGRQLPHVDATPIAAHARLFNYPATSRRVTLADAPRLGIKTCFLSNSFAAYRVRDLLQVGGFPPQVILGEDTAVAARLLQAGKAVQYQADACVHHSHNHTVLQELQRSFDIGVFHARESWLRQAFGSASGEGFRFVKSELRILLHQAPWLIPSAVWRTGLKLLGYRLGRAERWLPRALKRRLGLFRGYWDTAP